MPRQFGKIDESTKWSCDKCQNRHAPGSACPPTFRGRPGMIWLKRPMPDGQWPVEQSRPRDDSFSWWVRSHCGHQGGARQWAFYEERYADLYERIFRDDPCRYTRCQDRKRDEDA